ncbi:MAG: hypothetical protein DA330_09055 [Nitrososphaera sp.]|nr:hypothetical protein [Nitrososphaera sp.]
MNFELGAGQTEFLNKLDKVCEKIRPYEEECYLAEKINDRVIPEFVSMGMLGCPISKRYGGLGYDMLTFALAMERIGREGSSLRTFFSVDVSIGRMSCRAGPAKIRKKSTCHIQLQAERSWPLP